MPRMPVRLTEVITQRILRIFHWAFDWFARLRKCNSGAEGHKATLGLPDADKARTIVGNFGSAQRVDYTAIGPSVILASRIESACVPGEIFVSPEISELLSPELTEQAGEYELKGISGKTSLSRLVKL